MDVTFVCTGNRFRSVLAEAAFAAATNGLPVRVASYGMLDIGPAEPLKVAVLEAHAVGLDISKHRASCLKSTDLTECSLVIGFEEAHVLAAISDAGAPPERAFLLLELVDLLAQISAAATGDSIAAAEESITRAHARRLETRPRPALEIADPIGMRTSDQHAIGRRVYDATTALALALFARTERQRHAGS